jgi:hypothetical protein
VSEIARYDNSATYSYYPPSLPWTHDVACFGPIVNTVWIGAT